MANPASLIPRFWQKGAPRGDYFRDLHDEIDRVFSQFGSLAPEHGDVAESDRFALMPRIDVSETDSAVDIDAELPGVKREDLDVTLDGHTLRIEGKRESESREDKREYHRIERRRGSFRRVVSLGFEPSDEDVKARFSDGVLQVHIEKPREIADRPKKIVVDASGID